MTALVGDHSDTIIWFGFDNKMLKVLVHAWFDQLNHRLIQILIKISFVSNQNYIINLINW
jgi:hypothetical protein